MDRYFRTKNLNLAVFLYSSHQQISGVNVLDAEQKEFVFTKTLHLEELVWIYKFGNKDDDRLEINAHIYERARRELLDRLND